MHSLCIAEISRHEAVFLSQTMWVCQTGIGTGVDGDKKVLTEQLQFVYNSQLLYVSSSSRRLQLLRLAIYTDAAAAAAATGVVTMWGHDRSIFIHV